MKLMNPLWFEDLSCFYPELHLKVWALAVHNVKLERAMKNFEGIVTSLWESLAKKVFFKLKNGGISGGSD